MALQDYQLQLPDGTVLGPGSSVPVFLEEVTGLFKLTQGRGAPAPRGGADGTTPVMNYLQDRTVNVKYGAFNPSGGMRPALAPLVKAYTSIKDPSTVVMTSGAYLSQQAAGGSLPVSALQFKVPGLANPILCLGYPEASDTPWDRLYQYGEAHVTTQWAVPDGLLYDAPVQTSAAIGITAAAPGVTFPAGFPLAFGAASSNSAQVVNAGYYEAAPVYKITGPITNPKILNATTGDYLALNLALVSGDVAVVDVQAKAVRLNGVNRNGAMGTGSKWFLLPPGSTTLQLTSTDGTSVAGTVTAYWLNTYSTL